MKSILVFPISETIIIELFANKANDLIKKNCDLFSLGLFAPNCDFMVYQAHGVFYMGKAL